MTKSGLLVLALSMAFGAAAACSDRLATRFPHELHLSKVTCGGPGQPACVSCVSCHHLVPEPSGDPKVMVCEQCHQGNSAELLRAVHRPADRPQPLAYTIRFSHERHLAMSEIRGQCVTCHAGAVDDRSGKPLFPPMERCFQCHEHQEQWERSQCAPCHERHDLDQLLPQTFLKHAGDFQRRHGQLAIEERERCASCHTQSDCDDCHDVTQELTIERRAPEAITRDFVHRGDFLSVHAIEARSQPARCLTCHTPATCDGCHLERGVSGNRVGAFNPHPPGWVGANPQARDFHGRAARRNIAECASCHDQGPATNCIRCHQVGGPGGNPHPAGWTSNRSEDAAMCRYCHG